MAKSNMLLKVRGRFVRDPYVTDAKDGSGRKIVLGRIICEDVVFDQNGDPLTFTQAVEVKVFDDVAAQALIAGGAKKGSMIEVVGRLRHEKSEYEKEGEQRVSWSVVAVLDNPELHSAKVESHARNEDEHAGQE